VRLPDLDLPSEPLEYEIDLAPPPASGPEQPAPAPQIAAAPAQDAPANASEPEPESQSAPEPEPEPATIAAAIMRAERSVPAPQPLLAVEPTPAASATDIPILPSVDEDVAALSSTAEPTEERGAEAGAPNPSQSPATPVRALAIDVVQAPDRLAAAPIELVPDLAVPKVEVPIAAVGPIRVKPPEISAERPNLALEAPTRPRVAVNVPSAARAPLKPTRVKPAQITPNLSVEQAAPSAVKPRVPVAAVRTASERPAPRASQALTATELALERPTLNVRVPSAPAAENASQPAAPAIAADAAQSDAVAPASAAGAPSAMSSPAASVARSSESSTAPSDPFGSRANSTPGSGLPSGLPSGRDLFGQAGAAAGAQVNEGKGDGTEPRGNAFRRYHDPFADDAPNPLAGLRLREPQLFSDMTKYLVKTFGPAALGFAVGASSEIDDFTRPDPGLLIERWIQAHHSDLALECKRNQDSMDEHVRALLCDSVR
jgi:hypothetical protein